MRFAYRPYLVELFRGEPATEIYRPVVPLLVHGPTGTERVNALVDSGADYTMLPLAVAVATGIAVDRSRPGTIGGVGGAVVKTLAKNQRKSLSDGESDAKLRNSD